MLFPFPCDNWELGRTLYTSCWICDICACKACSSDCSRSCKITYIMSHGGHMAVTWHHTMAHDSHMTDIRCHMPTAHLLRVQLLPIQNQLGRFSNSFRSEKLANSLRKQNTVNSLYLFLINKKVQSIQWDWLQCKFLSPNGTVITFMMHDTAVLHVYKYVHCICSWKYWIPQLSLSTSINMYRCVVHTSGAVRDPSINRLHTHTHTHGFYRQHLFLQYWW